MNEDTKNRIAAINSGIIPEGYKKTKVGIVPVEWEIEKLSEIGKNYIGLTYTPEDTANTGLIVLRSSNIKDSKIDLNDCVFVKCEVSEKNRVKTNDILICARNGSSSLIGKSALITEAYSNLAFGAFMSVYRTKYYNYIFQAFQSFIIKKQILRNLGARINQITTADINQFKVPFPPLPEQQKIAEILSTQDKLIELQEKKIEQLKELKKAYLQKMFPKKGSNYPELRFKGFTDPWEQRKLGELANVKDSARISNDLWSDSGVPYIRASDLSNNDLSGVLFLSEETYSFYKNQTGAPILGDLLFNGGGEIGKAVLKRDDKPIYVQGGAVLYVQTSSATELVGEYLESYFQSPLAKKYIDIASAGGTIKHFTLGPSQEMPIIYPSLDEQRKIGDYFSKLDSLITLHQRKSEQEKQKKKALMQLLLTGKVRCI